jgi:DNA polymerase III subunit epsilon
MREIVFDTETTGLDPASGHRIVEIGCIEILNSIPTGQTFHFYLDPERDMPEEAFRVHGISAESLIGKPKFAEIAEKFLAFVGNAMLVAHNAEFDLRFVNAELTVLGHPPLGMERVVDTLALARRRHPGSPASLDALCQRYGIDASRRTKHPAPGSALAACAAHRRDGMGRPCGLRCDTGRQGALAPLFAEIGRTPEQDLRRSCPGFYWA